MTNLFKMAIRECEIRSGFPLPSGEGRGEVSPCERGIRLPLAMRVGGQSSPDANAPGAAIGIAMTGYLVYQRTSISTSVYPYIRRSSNHRIIELSHHQITESSN